MKHILINTNAIVNNLRRVHELAGDARVIAVLKGNAYGMGLLEIAEILAQEGIDFFAVTEVDDAVTLRDAGHSADILLLRSTAELQDITAALDAACILTIGGDEALSAASRVATERGVKARAHIEIDIGMGRYGYGTHEFNKIIAAYEQAHITIEGIYAHFPAAFGKIRPTLAQKAVFDSVLTHLKSKNIDIGMVHLANSSALFFVDGTRYDAVRIGSALTGRLPRVLNNSGLTSATKVQCAVSDIRELPKGSTIGYASVFKTKRLTKIAILPIGGADGFCLAKVRDSYRFRDALGYALSEIKGWLTGKKITVKLNGRRIPVLGHVGMGHTVIDMTRLDVKIGQIVEVDVNPVYAKLPRAYE
ncbi:MAG: alanine racemase [Oscillospiraceae bacterium]|nr:alanine racemase [Oscillospiraceae bacterium]